MATLGRVPQGRLAMLIDGVHPQTALVHQPPRHLLVPLRRCAAQVRLRVQVVQQPLCTVVAGGCGALHKPARGGEAALPDRELEWREALGGSVRPRRPR